jgi:glutamyl-tRNA reductase
MVLQPARNTAAYEYSEIGMKQNITLIGLNHRTANLDIRERFALTFNAESSFLPEFIKAPVEEVIILSTCNRVEVLASGQTADLADCLTAYWASARGWNAPDLAPYIYIHQNSAAVHHLFSVASSLDSMVLGEPQILGQLKEAYRQAADAGTTKTILNRLLHKAFSVAKRVRTETAVAANAVSISYAAVEMAKRVFDDMPSCKAMLIGAGEMAELAATHLLQTGVKKLLIANRTLSRAEELAAEFNGEAVPFDKMFERMSEADIIITSTGSPEPIIHAADIEKILLRRKQKPVFFIDIAVPRDISPDVNDLDNVYVYDIDSLKEVVEENLAQRKEEAVKAAQIVKEEAEAFEQWFSSLDLQPTIVDLIDHHKIIITAELERTLKKIGPVSEDMRQALAVMTRALTSKLSHAPIAFLKNSHKHKGADTAHIDLVRRIYMIDAEREHHR